MPFCVNTIVMTLDEIKELIKTDETRCLEMKKTTGELKEGMHSVCAMLNSDGGYVIFGIAPGTMKIIGQMVTDNTRKEIGREIRKLEPYINMPVDYIDVPDSDGKQLVVLHADKNMFADAPYVYDGKPYYKLESTTMQMPQQMYVEMLRQRDAYKFRWDRLTANNITVADLDEGRIRNAVALGVKYGRMHSGAEVEPVENVLGKMGLLNDGKPTNAAVVLFAKDTSDYPEMELKMGYFRGRDKMVFIDNKMEVGNFFDLHEAGVSFLYRNLRLGGEVKGLHREDELEIPVEALREALTNALCHRQYERTNGSVSLAIYDDRVEIVNPGKFPPQLNAESIKQPHESYPYNKSIAQVLYLTTYLEKWGSGAKRMIEHCREHNVSEPEWVVENDTVKIVFKRPSIHGHRNSLNDSPNDSLNDSLNERQKRIRIIIRGNQQISVLKIAEIVRCSVSTVRRDLDVLGIHWEGHSKTGHWLVN